MDNKVREKAFQDHIITQLAASGWLVGESSHYDKERALYREDLVAFVQESQPEGGRNTARPMASSRNATYWMVRCAS